MCFVAFEVAVVNRLLNGSMMGVCFGVVFFAISLSIMDIKLPAI